MVRHERPLPDNATRRGTAPQGGIVASANDLARYLQTMMNGDDDVLSAEGKARMMRPASEASPRYGLGWSADPADGTVWHAGTTPGFESLATMVPDDERAVVVLVNGGSGLGFGETTQLRDGITARALDLGAPLSTIRLVQPDFGSALIGSAVTGVLWALFRLGVAYTRMTALPGRQESNGPSS